MPDSPRDFNEALAFARAESANETEDWTGYCQRFVRTCYGIPALYGSAWAQWNGLDDDERHAGGDPADAPIGAPLFYKGASPYGHIMLAAREGGAWSNDLVRTGDIDFASRTAPTERWGQTYLGYGLSVNGYDLRLQTLKPVKPPQDKAYAPVEKAVAAMERAVERAKNNGEHRDVKVFRAELRQLRELHQTVLHR